MRNWEAFVAVCVEELRVVFVGLHLGLLLCGVEGYVAPLCRLQLAITILITPSLGKFSKVKAV